MYALFIDYLFHLSFVSFIICFLFLLFSLFFSSECLHVARAWLAGNITVFFIDYTRTGGGVVRTQHLLAGSLGKDIARTLEMAFVVQRGGRKDTRFLLLLLGRLFSLCGGRGCLSLCLSLSLSLSLCLCLCLRGLSLVWLSLLSLFVIQLVLHIERHPASYGFHGPLAGDIHRTFLFIGHGGKEKENRPLFCKIKLKSAEFFVKGVDIYVR